MASCVELKTKNRKMKDLKTILKSKPKVDDYEHKPYGYISSLQNYIYKLEKQFAISDVEQSLPDAEQCLKIQEQVKQYCYTDQDDKPVISSGGIRTIISRWKQMIG